MDVEHLLELAIEYGLSKGADLVEARFEEIHRLYVRFERDTIRSINTGRDIGIGIITYVDNVRGYSFTTEIEEKSIKETVDKAINVAKSTRKLVGNLPPPAEYRPQEYEGLVPKITKHPKDHTLAEKLELAIDAIKEALSHREVVSLITTYGERWGTKIFMNSDGLKRVWHPIITGLSSLAVVKVNGNIGRTHEEISGSMGLELFDKRDPIEMMDKLIKGAKDNAEGKNLKSGEYPIVADPKFAGVIAHESFGHLTEGDYVATRASILHDKLGKTLGSEEASIIESGDPVNYGYWVPYDDEGVATRKVYLVERGVLKNFLHSRLTASMMGMEPTGNARAINFRFPPIVRMRNTYFGPGDLSKEEVFEMIGTGIYAEGHSGGQTNDVGVFTFAANRAYWIENGEIKYPLKMVTVRGDILSFLKNIMGASKEVFVYTSILGGCGKAMQGPLPVGLGGPYLAVKKAIVGSG